jgi:hypothetical protein
MTDLKQYIAINRWYMTTKEMAEELGGSPYGFADELRKIKTK